MIFINVVAASLCEARVPPIGRRLQIIHLRDAAAAFWARCVFRLFFDPTQSIRCEKSRACRCARKCGRQKSPVAPAGDSPASERSDSYRSKTETRKMRGQPRHV